MHIIKCQNATLIVPHKNKNPEIRCLWINKIFGRSTNSSNLKEMILILATKIVKLKI